MTDLAKKHCVPCESGDPPLPDEKEDELIKQVPQWLLLRDPSTGSTGSLRASSGQVEHHRLRRQFKFKDFVEAMKFVNKVADLAESEGHHPDINIVYSRVTLDLFTHAVGGLSESDFILAAKINALL